MKSRSIGVIAILASIAFCIQISGVWLGPGWAMLHGSGLGILVILAWLGFCLANIWGAYDFLQQRNLKFAPVLFTIYALGILFLNERLLPTTPLKAWVSERAIADAKVENLHDEWFTTARGNPLGVRVSFTVRFPAKVIGTVGMSGLGVADDSPSPIYLQFTHQEHLIEPPRANGNDQGALLFEKDRVYSFTETTLPSFVLYNQETQEPCFRRLHTNMSDAEFEAALSQGRPVKYRAQIQVSSEHLSRQVVVATYVTSREYDAKVMYDTVRREGNKQCPLVNIR
jgi:hypothetical protein